MESGAEHSVTDAYMVNDHVTFADGKTQDVHLSFSNMSKAEQTQLNEQTSAIFDTGEPNPGDSLREQMSPQEYSQLMEEIDPALPSIQDEFAEWDVSTANQAAYSSPKHMLPNISQRTRILMLYSSR